MDIVEEYSMEKIFAYVIYKHVCIVIVNIIHFIKNEHYYEKIDIFSHKCKKMHDHSVYKCKNEKVRKLLVRYQI